MDYIDEGKYGVVVKVREKRLMRQPRDRALKLVRAKTRSSIEDYFEESNLHEKIDHLFAVQLYHHWDVTDSTFRFCDKSEENPGEIVEVREVDDDSDYGAPRDKFCLAILMELCEGSLEKHIRNEKSQFEEPSKAELSVDGME